MKIKNKMAINMYTNQKIYGTMKYSQKGII